MSVLLEALESVDAIFCPSLPLLSSCFGVFFGFVFKEHYKLDVA